MARDLMNENYYIPKAKGGKIPIRWTAPEVYLIYITMCTDFDNNNIMEGAVILPLYLSANLSCRYM